jgi:hypothetical protein
VLDLEGIRGHESVPAFQFTFQDTLCGPVWKCDGAPSLENCGAIVVSSCQICCGHGGTQIGFLRNLVWFSPQDYSTSSLYSFTDLSLMPNNIST